MDRNSEIVYFGHTIPKEIYEDYKNMEKLKEAINIILDNSQELQNTDRNEIKTLLNNMSEKFNQMSMEKPMQRGF